MDGGMILLPLFLLNAVRLLPCSFVVNAGHSFRRKQRVEITPEPLIDNAILVRVE